MEQKEIEKGVREIFWEKFPETKKGDFDFGKKQEQFESWDSFSHMELVSKIEEKFKVSLEMEEVIELDSPRRFVEIVDRKINQK